METKTISYPEIACNYDKWLLESIGLKSIEHLTEKMVPLARKYKAGTRKHREFYEVIEVYRIFYEWYQTTKKKTQTPESAIDTFVQIHMLRGKLRRDLIVLYRRTVNPNFVRSIRPFYEAHQ